MKERSLVLFTLLSQLAVGTFLILGTLDLLLSNPWETFPILSRLAIWIGPALALALLASLFHLGTPGNAYRATTNLRSSWLSREILFSLLFAGAYVAFLTANYLQLAFPYITASVLLAVLFGLALVYSESRVYRLCTVPGWNRWTTTASFFATMLGLGSLTTGVGLLLEPGVPPLVALFWLAWVLVLCFAIEIGIYALAEARLAEVQSKAYAHAPVFSAQPSPQRGRLWLSGAGALLFGLAVFPVLPAALLSLAQPVLALGALALVLVSEVIERARFYRVVLDKPL